MTRQCIVYRLLNACVAALVLEPMAPRVIGSLAGIGDALLPNPPADDLGGVPAAPPELVRCHVGEQRATLRQLRDVFEEALCDHGRVQRDAAC